MEISPVPGIRVLPVTKVRPVAPELTASFAVESSARPDDDTYSPDNKKASGAEESEQDSEDFEELPDDPRSEPVTVHLKSGNQVNYFA